MPFTVDPEDFEQFVSIRQPRAPLVAVDETPEPAGSSEWNAPTIEDLNDDRRRDFDWTGVTGTTEEDLARLEPDSDSGMAIARWDGERLRKLGIYRMMVMDVRSGPESDARPEWRRR